MEIPDSSTVRTEWGARVTWPDGHSEDWWGTQRDAERWYFYHDGKHSICTSQLIRRQIITTPPEVVLRGTQSRQWLR